MQDVFTLKNGVTMPRIGFGTYNTSDDEACRVVCDAVEVGYRLIDTAAIYENEAGIGVRLQRVACRAKSSSSRRKFGTRIVAMPRPWNRSMRRVNAWAWTISTFSSSTGLRTKSSSALRPKRSMQIPGALSRISTRTALCARSGFRTSNRITSKRS